MFLRGVGPWRGPRFAAFWVISLCACWAMKGEVGASDEVLRDKFAPYGVFTFFERDCAISLAQGDVPRLDLAPDPGRPGGSILTAHALLLCEYRFVVRLQLPRFW